MELRTIPLDDGQTTSASIVRPEHGTPRTWPAVILAHGAGTDRHHPSLLGWQATLAAAGYLAILFNFPYRERGRKLPDTRPLLERCWRAVIAHVRATDAPPWLAIGGRSMGGRMATYVVADGLAVDALVLLGYPLHPAGKPTQLRADHLPRIHVPALFVQGTRDALADLPRLHEALRPMPHATLHEIDQADHSFRVPKRTGRTASDVHDAIGATIGGWLDAQRTQLTAR